MDAKQQAATVVKHEPWWIRIASAKSADGSSKSLLRFATILVILAAAALGGWQFMKKSKAKARDEVADVVNKAQKLLPQAYSGAAGSLTEPSIYLASLKSDYFDGGSRRAMMLLDEKKCAEYVASAEKTIAELAEIDGKARGSADEWRYLNTLQQLHWYCALNSTDAAKRKSHLEKQTALLNDLDKLAKSNPLLSAEPDPTKPGVTLVGRWKSLVEKELASAPAQLPAIVQDAGVKGTIELEDGKKIGIKFYSRYAPKAVQNFIAHAKAGYYNGTAIFSVDGAAQTMTGGSALTRLIPDRPRAWHKDSLTTGLPHEPTMRLPIKKGVLTTDTSDFTLTGAHASRFVIHMEDGEELGIRGLYDAQRSPRSAPCVFAVITDGLDALESYMKSVQLVADVAAENKQLPTNPLKIKSIQIEGDQDVKTDDSWTPKIEEPKVPEQLPEEKQPESQPTTATSAPK